MMKKILMLGLFFSCSVYTHTIYSLTSEFLSNNFLPPTGGNVYYVATNGNDANNGTSLATPWKTLQRISSQNLLAGDIVYIRAGRYQGGNTGNLPEYSWLINGKNGSSVNPITIAAYPPDFPNGGRVVFDCSGFPYTSNHFGVLIQNCSYLIIKDI
ncbi:MAG: hypothetical protein ABUT20_26535 [Bacteroidota bacterium]